MPGSQDEREVVRCAQCKLVQFRTTNSLCRRCSAPLDPIPPGPAIVEPPQPRVSSMPARPSIALLICKTIRAVRIEQRLTQAEIGDRLDVTRNYVSKIESGRQVPTLNTLDRIAAALGIDIFMLFERAQDRSEQWARAA